MRVAYAVTTWNGPKLVETVGSLPLGARLLVLDNSVLCWPLAKAWNYAIERLCVREGYDAVVVMNDDVVLREDTGHLLGRALVEGIRWGDRELLIISGRHPAPTDAMTDEVDWPMLKAAQPHIEPGPDFGCFATTRRLLDTVGPFDENFNPAYFEDNDMHRRVVLAGFEGGAYAPYWHFRSVTVRSDPERKAVIQGGAFERNRNYYVGKWGGYLGQETYTVPFNGRAA